MYSQFDDVYCAPVPTEATQVSFSFLSTLQSPSVKSNNLNGFSNFSSSYTYQCLIRFKFVTEIYFVAQRTKQLCMKVRNSSGDCRPSACSCI